LPVAQFLVGPDSNPDVSATTPFTLAFTDQSTGSPTSWLWNFGDGTTSSDRNPAHTYTTMGDFTVSLLVTNAAGSNTATVTHAVQVGEPTIANFSYTTPTRNTADTSPFSVTFTDTSSNSPTSWLWNFGDGTTSTQQNPTHSYANWGRYTVSLTATNVLSNTALDVGNTSVKTMVDLVSVGLAPASSFTLSSGVGTLPITIVATDTSANSPTSWQWDFGDGTGATSQNTAHVYTTYGTRTITLTTYNTIGTQTSSQAVTITPPAVVTSFSHTTSGSTVPVTVTYTDTSSNSPTSWLWNFGDGTTSTQQNPTHTYTTSGTYTTTLTAVNFAGGNSNSVDTTVDRRTVYITVTSAGIHNFTVINNVYTSQHGTGVNVSGAGYLPGQSDVIVTVNANSVIGSISTAYPAFDVGAGWTMGDYVELRVLNYGYVLGAGGAGGGYGTEGTNGYAGGTAINVGSNVPFTIFNYGTIGGGGGGGGKGSTGDRQDGGGGGGGGAGYAAGAGGLGAHLSIVVDKYGTLSTTIYGSDGSWGGTTTGGAGGAGSWSGGIGGDGYGTAGGGGGNLGAAGSEGGRFGAAQYPGAGGAGGAAVLTNGHPVVWGATGTRLGVII
jgi:PKD repeat protein